MLHVVLDELLDLGLAERLRVHVDEDRPGERRVGALQHRLHRRLDRLALLVHDRDRLELVLVLDVVRVAEVAEPVDVARHALHQDVVVLGRGEVAAARLRLADHRLGEVVERAGVGAGAEQLDRRVRPGRVHLVPAGDLALRARLPHLLELGHGEGLDEVVLRVDDDGERVERDRQLEVLDAGLLAVRHLLLEDRPRGVRDVGFAAAELLEAAAGAGDADRDLDRRPSSPSGSPRPPPRSPGRPCSSRRP